MCIDDFAFKKGNTYGTIVVDETTHRPVALLNGRDSDTLKEWLKNNRHIKTVTRDRAGAYASALSEVLPDAMQIADRFHLHQNLLETIRNVLQGSIPANIKIPEDELHTAVQPDNKKCYKIDPDDLNNLNSADDCADVSADGTALKKIDDFNENPYPDFFSQKRLLYKDIHKLYEARYSMRGISRKLKCSRNTVIKYLNGDIENICTFHLPLTYFCLDYYTGDYLIYCYQQRGN